MDTVVTLEQVGHVMWLTDKSMDGMVGQVQNCLFCQTPSVIKCGNMETRQSGRVAADCKSVLSGE